MNIAFREGTPLYTLFQYLTPKRRAFQIVLQGTTDAGAKRTVLLDLAKFCRAEAPCKNEREEGRREVWLHIRKLLKLPDDELTVMYSSLSPEQRYQLYYPSATYTE